MADSVRPPAATDRDAAAGVALERAFQQAGAVVQGETELYVRDLQLLQDVNTALAAKYATMCHTGQHVKESLTVLHQKYEDLEPYFAQVEEINRNVEQLEAAVASLDEYTKRLAAALQAV
eukprot:TRINITY_DN1172_c0_g1_i1.p1 TRINITY_DN1172_c0_g1~~TRINITY_DN1172_c0_g1_i1.p1  ORF type:complete len:137 (-),score=40.48 TRINITY_DN1172_c0_g1_i1:133-492(-)